MNAKKLIKLIIFLTLAFPSFAYAWGSVKDDIYRAARQGDTYTLNRYIQQGYSIDTADSNGTTALCSAYFNGDTQAYNLLIRYGANPYANCMYKATSHPSMWKVNPYVVGGAVAVGVGIAAAVGGGGGGGGSGSSSASSNNNFYDNDTNDNSGNSSGNNDDNNGDGNINDNTDETSSDNGNNNDDNSSDNAGDNTGGNSGDDSGNNGGNDSGGDGNSDGGDTGDNTGSGDNSGSSGGDNTGDNTGGDSSDNGDGNNVEDNDNTGNNPSGDSGGSDSVDTTAQKIALFTNSSEYNGGNFTKGSTTSVNYLGAIRAAQAYSKFIDTEGNFIQEIKPVLVGVLDNGVWANHGEFYVSGSGSKVSGHNYDYGPCQGSDTSYCWAIKKHTLAGFINIGDDLVLYGENKNTYIEKYTFISQKGIQEYYEWKAQYPEDYDWNSDKYNSSFFPNDYETSGDSTSMHGTNVAGIIAANKNGYGNMGVAFMNAKIDAIRWDMRSPVYNSFAALFNDGAEIVNMSYGTDANSSKNAANINSVNTDDWDDGILKSARLIISNHTTKNGHTDGMILVKAAGNEEYSQPDIQSGLKLYSKTFTDSMGNARSYSEIQMLVVVAVDVELKGNGDVSQYKLSEFSNQCGVTQNYCIAAPGGNTRNGYADKSIYSAGQPGVSLYNDADTANYVDMVGTSQAAPVVSGALAFLKGAYPYLSSSELIDLILTTANKEDADYYTAAKYGAGLLDLGKATDYVPLENGVQQTYTSSSVNSVPIMLNSAHLSVSSSLKNSLAKSLPENITVFDRYNRPFAMPTKNYISATHGGYKTLKNDVNNIAYNHQVKKLRQGNFDLRFSDNSIGHNKTFMDVEFHNKKHTTGFYFKSDTAYDVEKPFSRDLKNPFMMLQSAYGIRDSYTLDDVFSFNVEALVGKNGLYDGDRDFNDSSFKKQAYALNSEFRFWQNKKFSFGLTSGILYEDEAMLGTNGDGAFAISGSNTYNFGINTSWHATKNLTLSSGYYLGYTKARNLESDMLRFSNLVSDSFAIAADYAADKQTNVGMMLSSPLKVQKGKAYVKFASGRDNYSDAVYYDEYAAKMRTNKREYKFSVYMNKDLSDSISLRSQADVRINPEHSEQKNDYRVLFGLSWAFN